MFIVSDDGRDVINVDSTLVIGVGQLTTGEIDVVIVTGLGAQTVVVKGGLHRCEAAMRAIVEALAAQSVAVLRMDEAPGVGPRPKDSPIAVAKLQVPSSLGNGGRGA